MNASQLLTNSLSPDQATRQNATEQLEAAARDNYPGYVATLSQELANEQSQVHIRNAASVALKNALTARDATRQAEYSNRWLTLPDDLKEKIKSESLMTLGSPTPRVGLFAAAVVAAIASVELPANQWANLVQVLLQFVSNAENPGLRIATLSTIGFICEQIKPEILSARSNEILTAIVQGARKEETNTEVNLAAMHALYNSLEFVRENFEREGERNYLMQVVCEATQNSSSAVQVAAFECLVRIMGLYYDKMGFYMERALFGLTVLGMKSTDNNVVLQAIEFWSTVCEEEAELAIEAADAYEYGLVPERESKEFAKIALPEILPVILQLLMRQEEDADDDEWNVSMAAGTALSLLATAVADIIVQAVIPFIEANIASADWHQREAAVMAFGSILDGPDPVVLQPLIHQALPLLINMLSESETNMNVKDTAAWTVARICDLHASALKPDVHIHPIITAVVAGLAGPPRISTNCSWAIQTLAENLSAFIEEDGIPPTSPLSPYYEGIMTALMQITEQGGNESNRRTAAYEALAELITQAAQDTLNIVSQVVLAILGRQEQLLAMQSQIIGQDDRNNWVELQSNFCSILVAIIRKLGAEIKPLGDRIMTNVLQLIQSGKQSSIIEDAFLVAGTMASALEADFQNYLNAFLPFLFPALKAVEDQHLCIVAIGIIGDVCRALGEQSTPYCNQFMNALVENLQNLNVSREVKLAVLGCFGDIAMAIGANYEPYLATSMAVLHQAGEIVPNPLDYDSVEYVNTLRETIIEAEVGIVTGLKGSDKISLIVPFVPQIFDLLARTNQDEERSDVVYEKSVGLVGDLADAFPNGEIRQYLLAEWVITRLFKNKPSGLSGEAKRTVKWAKEMVRKATASAGF